MKVRQAAAACTALQKLLEQEMDYQDAYAIKRLYDNLKSEFELIVTEENRLMEQFAKKDSNGRPVISGNTIAFAATEDRDAFSEGLKKLNGIEIDRTIELISIAAAGIKISAADIAALDGFVIFE